MSERRVRREDLDVATFPCMARDCSRRADGWADRQLLDWMRIEIDADPAAERIYLCNVHLRPIKDGTGGS